MPDLHLPLDRAAGRLSAQIAAGFRAGIRSGRLAAGTRLPSTRELARDLDVSRGVVVSAYEQLTAEGFLTSRRGDGTRVAKLARPDRQPAAAEPAASPAAPAAPAVPVVPVVPAAPAPPRPPAMAYDLRPGHPDLAAFPRGAWLAAIRTALRTIPHSALAYPDPAGVAELRAELAGYLGRVRAAHVAMEQVTVLNGVAHGLSSVARVLAAAGHRALAVEDPTSARQLPTLQQVGPDILRIPVDREGIDVAALARTDARAVLVTPAHQFPTGFVLSPRRRAALIDWARCRNGLVLEDDYDAEFRYDRDPVGCLQGIDPERVVLMGSVSKALAPALRLGWAAAPGWLAGRLRDLRAHTDLGGNAVDQHALAHLIASGGYDRHLRVMRRQYRARRDALAGALRRGLPGAVVRGVSAGLHLYVELPAGYGEDEVVAAAAAAGVAVEGAARNWSRPGPPALVLGYAQMTEGRLVAAAELLARAVARL